ncbi:MAG: M13 family metallopeptidase [Byssovorax sp.]
MKYIISLLALLAVGCGGDDGPSGIDVTALDQSADPCVDFYQFACGGWTASHPISEDGSLTAKFFEPDYAAFPRLRAIIVADSAGAREADDPHAALIGDYYTSCRAGQHDSSSRAVLLALLAELDAVTTLDELARRVAAQRDVGSGSFFQFYVSVDPGDATRYTATLFQGGTELADRAYYLDADHADVLVDYKAHITSMSALLGGTPIDAEAVVRVETALAQAALPGDELRDPEKLYHPMKAEEAAALAPTFPWQIFWSEAGFAGLERVNVAQPGYLTALEVLFKTAPLEDLKSYMRWQLLQDQSSALDQPFLDEDFQFWSSFTGQTAQQDRAFTCLNKTLHALGEAITLPYVARHFDEASSKSTRAMFERERGAFARRLEKATWLDPLTKSEALAKLDAVVAKVGHPDKGPDLTGLVIDKGSFIGNEIRLRQLSHARSRAQLAQPVDRTVWFLSPLSVNASYGPTANAVTLPAALLAVPFLQASRTNAANFGALGAVIGHEITHGFDDRGRHYDGNGTLRDWWTPGQEASFEERSQCLVDQFDAFEPLPGEHVDGELTLGENIADLGGLNIAFAALFDENEDEVGGDGFDAKQVFFLSYAQTWCENVRPDLRSYWLLTDPHAPGNLRVNGPLSNLPEFREAFSCSESDPMVRAETCEVW